MIPQIQNIYRNSVVLINCYGHGRKDRNILIYFEKRGEKIIFLSLRERIANQLRSGIIQFTQG